MKVSIVPGRQLTAEMCARWDEIQRSNSTLSNPFFRPELTQAVAAVRSDVYVAVIEGDGGIEGFFPYQRQGWSGARPVGGRLSDFQGLIVRSGFECDPRRLLQQCGLSSWRFDHLLPSQAGFQPYMWTYSASPYLDLSQGFAAYEAERRQHTTEVAATKRRLAKLGREVGPIRLVWRSTDREALQTLMRWKSDQYIRTGLRDLFSFEWIRAFIDDLFERNEPGLAGMLSCLYAGDRLVAAHFGMSSHHVAHWWFPSYDREWSKYSPGRGLIYSMSEHAHEHGITRIDLGKGDEDYKFKMASGVDQVAEGSVDLRLSSRLLGRTWQTTRDWVKKSPLRGPTEVPLRWIRWMRDWLSFR